MLTQVVMQGSRPYPPRVSEFTKPFWDALSTGGFISTECRHCNRLAFPPKVICPDCWSDQIVWAQMPRFGSVYSWTRVHAAPAVFRADAPYFLAIVDLEERVRLACRLLAEEAQSVQIGAPIEMVSMRFSDGPMFAARIRTNDTIELKPDEARMPALRTTESRRKI